MYVDLYTITFVLSLVAMFGYQFSAFSYTSSLLVGGSKNKWHFVFFSVINTSLFTVSQLYDTPVHLLLLIFLFALTVEFKMISKTDYVQVFCGASIFVLHMFALITPLIIIAAHITQTSPVVLINSTVYDNIVVIIACVVLSLAHEVVKKYIDNNSIQRVTVKSRHSIILLFSIVIVVALQLNHVITMVSDVLYPAQILLSLTVSFASLLIFYLFFLYSINLIDASLYKRYSDQVISEHEKISKQKEKLIIKIEKDELTGVYNRRFAMSTLEEMCEDSNSGNLFYVLFVDINALKYTNDTFGHKAGDRLIIKIAHAILNTARENDIVARIGGDEILVILTDLSGEDCGSIVERIQQGIEVQNSTEEFLVSASIGSVFVDEEMRKMGASHILSIADENMRKNKELFYKQRKEGAK